MTNTNPTPGIDTGLPALMAHIQHCQTKAGSLQALINVLSYVDNEGVLHDEMTVLIEIADKLARELNRDLDSVSLPEVRS